MIHSILRARILRMTLVLTAALVAESLFFATTSVGQSGSSASPSSVAPPTASEVTAVFVNEAPRIDGIIDEMIWQQITPITDLIQIWPDDGSPPTEASEIRIAYDRDNLYFAFTFYDREPHLIRAKNLERGGRNDRDDHAYISLDTYQDDRNAYLFEMNALGTQDDATITDEGLTIDSFSWDAVFRSETQITDEGWTMEVSIPFRQLRFPKGQELEFGLMLSRMINRKNERSIWPRIGLEFGNSFTALAAVSQYGTLKGLKNVRRGKNIEIKPYVIAGAQKIREDLEFEETESDFTRDIGVDLKYGVTSNVTLDLSVNTDFAQVEADNVQLNLSRFSLFFPEKREFFLERSGLFEHGNPRSTQTFFSRRIGLSEDILAGARVTAQFDKISVGVLNIETGSRIGDIFGSMSTNNTVARVRANVLPRASAGAIFTNLQQGSDYNRAIGVDGQIRFWSSSEVNAWYSTVSASDPNQEDAAGYAGFQLLNDRGSVRGSFTSVGRNYRPALGFVRRRNMHRYFGNARYTPVVSIASIPAIRRLSVETEVDYIEGLDGEKQTTEIGVEAGIEFNRRDNIGFGFTRTFERLENSFFIRQDAEIPAADYTFSEVSLRGQTDSSRRLFLTVGASSGGFFSGNRTDLGGSVGFRQSRHLNVEAGVDHSIIDLPITNGNFTATTVSLSLLGGVNRKLFAKGLIQYDNFSRDVQANIRVDWIHTPGSDLFLVFNTSYHLAGDNDILFDPRKDLLLNNRVGVLKLTYLVLL